MNTRSYEYLIAIADKASLSRAARALGLSQPTLSSFLTGVEEQLGHTLFERSGKALIPTEAGQIYLTACRRIVDVKCQTYHSIAHLNNQYSESFTVGLTPHRGTQTFSRVFPDFCQRYPDIRVDLQEGYMGDIRAALEAGTLDLALGTLLPEDMQIYDFSSQSYEELFLCVPVYHPFASLSTDAGSVFPPIPISRFADTPFVMWGDQTTNRRVVQNHLLHNNLTPTVVYESNNVMLIDVMLQNGIGVGFLPATYCRPGQNRVYFSMDPPLRSLVGIFYRKGQVLTEAQRYLIYLIIRSQVGENPQGHTYLNNTSKEILREFEGE